MSSSLLHRGCNAGCEVSVKWHGNWEGEAGGEERNDCNFCSDDRNTLRFLRYPSIPPSLAHFWRVSTSLRRRRCHKLNCKYHPWATVLLANRIWRLRQLIVYFSTVWNGRRFYVWINFGQSLIHFSINHLLTFGVFRLHCDDGVATSWNCKYHP